MSKLPLVRVTQTGSQISRQDYQEKILIALGLNKLNKSRILELTPSIQGMIRKVAHLLKVEENPTLAAGEAVKLSPLRIRIAAGTPPKAKKKKAVIAKTVTVQAKKPAAKAAAPKAKTAKA